MKMSNFTIYDQALTGMNNVNFYAFGLSYSGEIIEIIDNSIPGQVTYSVFNNPSVDQFSISYTTVNGGYIINDIVATYGEFLSFEAHNVGEFVTVDQVINNDLFSNIPLDGFNTFNGNSYDDVIDAGAGDDVVYGNGGNDIVFGGDGNDYLVGGAGTDVLYGGFGDDVFLLDSPYDQFADDGGIDTLVVSYNDASLPDGPNWIENLMFDGFGNFSGRGNALNNLISGGAGKDILQGMGGNDMLSGHAGNDILSGGRGKDIFVFDAVLGTSKTDRKVNFDMIKDFKVTDDTIWLDNAVFRKLSKAGTLSKSFFTIGSNAKDKNDYVVYDNKKGVLSYDADGSGKGKAVEVAQLSKNLKMTHKDFFIF
jgi:Ca2+-binding RTX toxin-like protein